MKEEDEARLAKAAMKSLLVPAPQSLKDDLKRMARNRKPASSIWERFAIGLGAVRESAWAYGAGAVFAAAAIGVFVLRAVPPRQAAPSVAERPAQRPEVVAPQALADLWSDDDGEDNDEI